MAEPIEQPVAPPNTDVQPGQVSGPPPIPAGFSDTPPAAPPTPAGFSDEKPSTENVQKPEPSFLEKAGDVASNVAEGFGKSLMGTVEGLGELIKKSPQVALTEKLTGKEIIPRAGLEAEKKGPDTGPPVGIAQMIGYGGENLAEFLLGDEALKGLSMADKFSQISGVMKILEKSPRLMRAIQMGVDVGKAATELGPEEQAAIKQSPRLARLVGLGMDAARQGAVQAAQTTVKTGGDVGQAAKEAGTMAGTSAVLGGTLGEIGGALKKAGTAGEAVKTASEIAKGAPSKLEIGQKVADQVQTAEEAMHGDFEAGIQKLTGDLKGQKVPYTGSPIQKEAQAVLQGKAAEKGTLGGEFRVISGGSPESKKLLTALSDPKKTGDLTIDELIQRRQQLGEKIGQLTRGATSSADRADVAVYQKLRDGIDDTIEQLAQQSGKPEAAQNYADLRNAYKGKVNLFKEPVVRAMQAGDLDNAAKSLLAGGKVLDKINTLSGVIGEQGVKDFGQSIAARTLADATSETGQINPSKFAKDWKKIDALSPEVKSRLFDMTGAGDGLDALSKDLKSAANYQKLVRAGLLGSAGTVTHGWGLALGLLGHADMGRATEILDKVANNPRLWSAFRTAGAVGEKVAASPAARLAGTAAKYGTSQALGNIMQGAEGPLSSPIQKEGEVYTNQ